MTTNETLQKEMAELNKTMAAIHKKYGKGVISNGDEAEALKISRISTGSFSLDVETGGGIPENRITIIAGHYGSAKTTVALKIVAQAQKKYPNKKVLWVDAEGALELEWAEKNGVDLDNMIILRPDYAEQAYDIIDAMIRTLAISLVVVDSIAALLPSKELESSMEDNQMGLAGLLNSKFMRKVNSSIRYNRVMQDDSDTSSNITVLLLNQYRKKIGIYGGDVMPGGEALGFYASLIVKLRRGDWKVAKVNGRDENIGQECHFVTEKNKTFPPKRTGTFDLYFTDANGFSATQIDRVKEVVTYAVLWDAIVKKGGWYYVGETKFQGGEKVLEYIKTNEEARLMVEERVMELATRGKAVITVEESIDPDSGEIMI